ncbi:DUF4105 domain-containing protein [Thalassolituus sp. LLYu03]|uniref:Lnb N-terminal periplasmic domain-containing protein n=1 Tax=Thalassolituus sp. LLYu03 TaxID=3421656 RepID=UPI003D26C8BD
MLHFDGARAAVSDPAFLLSLPDFSPAAEWRATQLAFRENPHIICRFPARYLLMKTAGEALPEAPACPDYQEFLQQAPADSISVIYASENLVNPSSMLGHGMLSLAGRRADGFYAQHSVSFFTELDSMNPLKVIWETLVEGKPGFFLVKPLAQHYEFYNLAEQRNVWRYELDLTADERHLLQAHLWELRTVQMDYFFHTQNCATVSADLLRLVIPELTTGAWVTPIDLVKAVNRSGKIRTAELVPSAKWRVQMLEDVVSAEDQNQVYRWQSAEGSSGKQPEVTLSDAPDQNGFLQRSLANAVLDFRQQTRRISADEAHQLRTQIPQVSADDEYELTLEKYRSPLKTPDDAHWSLGYQRTADSDWISADWLAVGHGLEDDNRQYFSENELKLFELSLRASPEQQALRLNHLALYSARSLNPWDRFTGGISGDFRLGFFPLVDDELQSSTAWNVHGGVGMTFALSPDLRVYGLMNAGWYRNREADFMYAEPEIGAYLYEVFDMKSWLRYQPRLAADQKPVQRLTLTHSIYGSTDSALIAEAARVSADGRIAREMSLSWRLYF